MAIFRDDKPFEVEKSSSSTAQDIPYTSAAVQELIDPSHEEDIQGILLMAAVSKRRKWCSKHRPFGAIGLACSLGSCTNLNMATTESIQEIISSVKSPDDKFVDIKAKFTKNEADLYTLCLARQALSSHFYAMMADRSITLETHRILENIALERLLPKIHCLRAQARHRVNIRYSLDSLIASIQQNDAQLIKQCGELVEMHYQNLEKCKQDGCGGEWTECCSKPERLDSRADSAAQGFGNCSSQAERNSGWRFSQSLWVSFLERVMWLGLGGMLVALGTTSWSGFFSFLPYLAGIPVVSGFAY